MPGDGRRRSWPRASTGSRPRTSGSCRRPRSSGRTCRSRCSRRSRSRPRTRCDGASADLQAAEFLYEARLFPDLEYTFKHALTHDVAYGSLLQDRRRALHARIVEAIERLYPDRLAEHVERLAHHAFRGELWEKAVTYLRQAGAKAFARSANREAVAYFEQALTALTPSPRDPRDAGAGHRSPLRPSKRALPAGGIRDGSKGISGKPKPWPGRSTISGDSDGYRPT